MMYSEFIEISGMNQVSYTEYTEAIEPLYMASPEPTKEAFIKSIKKNIPEIISEYRKQALEDREQTIKNLESEIDRQNQRITELTRTMEFYRDNFERAEQIDKQNRADLRDAIKALNEITARDYIHASAARLQEERTA